MKRNRPKRSRPMLWIGIVLLGVIGLYPLLTKPSTETVTRSLPTLPPSALDGPAPDFLLATLDGTPVSLRDYSGKVLILDFWASWCAPCKREIPDFIDLQRAYGGDGLQVVGIALDDEEPIRDFAAKAGINYPVLIGNQHVANLYGGIIGIPTTFIIDARGTIVARYEGFRPRAVFEQHIKELLNL